MKIWDYLPSEAFTNRIMRVFGFLFFLGSMLVTMARWTGGVDEKLDMLADKLEQRRIQDSFQYQEIEIRTDALKDSVRSIQGTADELKECKQITALQGNKISDMRSSIDWLSGRVHRLENLLLEDKEKKR